MSDQSLNQHVMSDDDPFRRMFQSFDLPAYIRRGLALEEALQRTDAQCRKQRREFLKWVKMRLRAVMQCELDDATSRMIEPLVGLLETELLESEPSMQEKPVPVSPRKLRGLIQELKKSVARFNRRWRDSVENMDLGAINRQVDDYNQYYLIEKECALQSYRLARQGYRPYERITVAQLLEKHRLIPSLQTKA